MWKINLYETLILNEYESPVDFLLASTLNKKEFESIDKAKQVIEVIYLWRSNKIWIDNKYISYLEPDKDKEFPIILASIEEV